MQAGQLYLVQSDQEGAEQPKRYYDRKSGLTQEEYFERLDLSTTLYMGNLSFFTTE
jgi:nuclear cap-binding protein subunit 2